MKMAKSKLFTTEQVLSSLGDSISESSDSDLHNLKKIVDEELSKRIVQKDLERHKKSLEASEYLYSNIDSLDKWVVDHEDNCNKRSLDAHTIISNPDFYCPKCVLDFVKNNRYNEYFYLKGFIFDVVPDDKISKYGDNPNKLKNPFTV